MSKLELTVSKTIPAPRQRVFEAWLDPAVLARFMMPIPGMQAPHVECDPREGGNFLIVMKAGDKELPHRGEYREISRHDRLVFTWESEFATPGSSVTLTFEELGPSETKVTLHHVGFPSNDSRDNHQGGWTQILETLCRVVG